MCIDLLIFTRADNDFFLLILFSDFLFISTIYLYQLYIIAINCHSNKLRCLFKELNLFLF